MEETRKIREEMAKILGLDPSNEDVLKNIENENEHTISYQLDEWEIDRFQELRNRLKEISEKNKPQPEQKTKGEHTTGTADQTTPKSEPEKATATTTTDGATAGKSTPEPNDKDKTMKAANTNGFLLAVGSVIKAILDFIENLRGKVPSGGIRDKLLGKIENGLKKVAGRPVAVNISKTEKKVKEAENQGKDEPKGKDKQKGKDKPQGKDDTSKGTKGKAQTSKAQPVKETSDSSSDRRTEVYTRDMKWAQGLVDDNTAEKALFQTAMNEAFRSIQDGMNGSFDEQNSVCEEKVRVNKVPHVGKTAFEDWLLYLTVNKLRSMAGNHNISINDEKTKKIRPLEDVYKELVEKVNEKLTKSHSTAKEETGKQMSQAALNLKWVIEQRDGPKGDRLFDKFEDEGIEAAKPIIDSAPKKGEEDYDQKKAMWINDLIKLKEKYNIPDVDGANPWAEVEGSFILSRILDEADIHGISLVDENHQTRHIKDIYKDLEDKLKSEQKQATDSDRYGIYSEAVENRTKEDLKWAFENIVQKEKTTPFMRDLYEESETTIDESYADDKDMAEEINRGVYVDIGISPRDTLISNLICARIVGKAYKQGIPLQDKNGNRPIGEIYKDLVVKMELVEKTNRVSQEAANSSGEGKVTQTHDPKQL